MVLIIIFVINTDAFLKMSSITFPQCDCKNVSIQKKHKEQRE